MLCLHLLHDIDGFLEALLLGDIETPSPVPVWFSVLRPPKTEPSTVPPSPVMRRAGEYIESIVTNYYLSTHQIQMMR